MARKIILKYDGTCINCDYVVPKGQTAYWEKGTGVWHIDCETAPRTYKRRTPSAFATWYRDSRTPAVVEHWRWFFRLSPLGKIAYIVLVIGGMMLLQLLWAILTN